MSTIIIDDDLLNRVVSISNYQNAQDAVVKILSNYLQQQDERIDTKACIEAFEKIEKGDRSGLMELGDIDIYIENLRHEINQN